MLTPTTAKHLQLRLSIKNDSLVDALAFYQNNLAIATRNGKLYTTDIIENTRTEISEEAEKVRALVFVNGKLFSAHPHGIYYWAPGAARQLSAGATASLTACNGQLVSGGDDGSIRFWDVENLQEQNLLTKASSPIRKLACHGSHIVAAAQTIVVLWDVDTGKSREIARADEVRSVDISANRIAVVVGSLDHTALFVYDHAGNLIWEQKERFLQDVSFSPDGTLLVTPNTTIQGNQIWHAETGALITRVSYPGRGAFSPDGSALVLGGHNTLEVFVADTVPASHGGTGVEPISNQAIDRITEIGVLYEHGGEILSLDFHPLENRILASAGADSTVIIWDTATAEILHVLDNLSSRVKSVKYTPDGQHLLVGEGDFSNQAKAYFVDTQTYTPTGRTLEQRSSGFPHLAVNGKYAALKYTIFDLESGEVFREFSGHRAGTNQVAFNHDGTHFAIAVGSDTGMSGNVDNAVKVYNVTSGELVHELRQHKDWVMHVDFSLPNPAFGELVTGVDVRGYMYGWKVKSGQLLAGGDGITALTNPPDPLMGVVANRDLSLRLLNFARGGGDGVRLEGHTDTITCIVFNKDSTVMASGSKDRSIRLWGVPAN